MSTYSTLSQIISHTPHWVFGIFVLLAWRGGRLLAAHEVGLKGITVMPLFMIGLAISGVVSAFGRSPAGGMAVAAWAFAAVISALAVMGRTMPSGGHYDAASRTFRLPGSPWPLVLMMSVFLTKYAVGVTLSLHPDFARDSAFALGISAIYGLFSGIFAGRALALWRVVVRTRRVAVPT